MREGRDTAPGSVEGIAVKVPAPFRRTVAAQLHDIRGIILPGVLECHDHRFGGALAASRHAFESALAPVDSGACRKHYAFAEFAVGFDPQQPVLLPAPALGGHPETASLPVADPFQVEMAVLAMQRGPAAYHHALGGRRQFQDLRVGAVVIVHRVEMTVIHGQAGDGAPLGQGFHGMATDGQIRGAGWCGATGQCEQQGQEAFQVHVCS